MPWPAVQHDGAGGRRGRGGGRRAQGAGRGQEGADLRRPAAAPRGARRRVASGGGGRGGRGAQTAL